jgi:hypothetical protein
VTAFVVLFVPFFVAIVPLGLARDNPVYRVLIFPPILAGFWWCVEGEMGTTKKATALTGLVGCGVMFFQPVL